jgi:phosphoglycolate phosphatase
MKIKAVVFDLDGTLLDTLGDLADSVNTVLHEAGYPTHPEDAYRYFVGNGIFKLIERTLPPDQRKPEVIADFVQRFNEVYKRNWNAKTKPYPGIPELLRSLVAKGLDLAILSNKPHEATLETSGFFLKDTPFKLVYGARPGVPVKPDPTAAFEIARAMGYDPAEFAYLGDTSIDMSTANQAGMFAVGVTWGFRTPEELREYGAKVLIDHPMELLEHI